MHSALEIEPEVDVLLKIRFELRGGPGEPDHAEQADEHGRHNHNRFDHQIPLHVFCLVEKGLLLDYKGLLFNHLGAFGCCQGTYSGAGELQFQVIRLDSDCYCLTVHGRNGTDNAAGGDDRIAALEALEHLLLALFLLLHGHKQKKIKDYCNKNEGERLHRDGGDGLFLEKRKGEEHG
jgi:hypothetical protein